MIKKIFFFLVCAFTTLAQTSMKISQYPAATTAGSSDLFLLAYYNGVSYTTNKSLSFANFSAQLLGINDARYLGLNATNTLQEKIWTTVSGGDGQINSFINFDVGPGLSLTDTAIVGGGRGISYELSLSGVTAGVYGNASYIPQITVNARGQVTALTTNLVSPSTGLGITNKSGIISNNIVAGSNITITAGGSGQLTIAASGGGGSAPTGTMVSSGSWSAGDLSKASDTTGTNFVHITAQQVNDAAHVLTALGDAATITGLDLSASDQFIVTLGGNRTLPTPSNIPSGGKQFTVWFVQDATGMRTISFPTNYLYGEDLTGITLTTNAGFGDRVTFDCFSTNSVVRAVRMSRKYQF